MNIHLYPWHEAQFEKLQNIRQRLPHALLFYGPDGTGIDEFAWYFAQSLLCSNTTLDGKPCNQCESCHWFNEFAHPDFKALLSPAQEMKYGFDIQESVESNETETTEEDKNISQKISILQVRALFEFLTTSSHSGGVKIVLIFPVEVLTIESSNALLKMLEEPPENTYFILVTHHIDQLLPTILSRCFKIPFALPEKNVAISWMQSQGAKDAQTYLDQEGGVPLTALEYALNGVDPNLTIFLETLIRPTTQSLLNLAESLAAQKIALATVYTWYQRFLYDLMAYLLTQTVRYYPHLKEHFKQLSTRINQDNLLAVIKQINFDKRFSQHPLVLQLALENMLLTYKDLFSTTA